MLDNQFEIGHFEPCTRITGKQTLTIESFTDTFWTNCHGPYDTGGRGPEPRARRLSVLPVRGHPRGHGAARIRSPAARCSSTRSATWTTTERRITPTGRRRARRTGSRARSPRLSRPRDGRPYPQIQFETDTADTESTCDLGTGAGCMMPPPGPGHFYPYWTLVRDHQLGCTWQFGNAGQTGQSFGGDDQYGQITFAPPGAFTSRIQRNPSCERR